MITWRLPYLKREQTNRILFSTKISLAINVYERFVDVWFDNKQRFVNSRISASIGLQYQKIMENVISRFVALYRPPEQSS